MLLPSLRGNAEQRRMYTAVIGCLPAHTALGSDCSVSQLQYPRLNFKYCTSVGYYCTSDFTLIIRSTNMPPVKNFFLCFLFVSLAGDAHRKAFYQRHCHCACPSAASTIAAISGSRSGYVSSLFHSSIKFSMYQAVYAVPDTLSYISYFATCITCLLRKSIIQQLLTSGRAKRLIT